MADNNRFFTIMIVPEKTQKVRKLIIPSLVVKGFAASASFLLVLAIIMVLDYANVMNQITENKKLRVENRQLRQSVQIFKDKMVTIESTLDRVKTFATKLRIITNIEEQPASGPAQSTPLPSLNPGSGDQTRNATPAVEPAPPAAAEPVKEAPKFTSTTGMEADTDEDYVPQTQSSTMNKETIRAKRRTLIAALMTESPAPLTLTDADTSLFVSAEFEKLDQAHEAVNQFAMEQEREAQYILEKLGDKQAIIAGTPTLLPTRGGYITSPYSDRISPLDNRRKMHEGIDIANRYGADIIAPANGVVVFSGMKSGYGRVVVVDHSYGVETYFAHLSRAFIHEGERVRRGQRIASVGSSGHSTGPHLHYEVRVKGLPVDPCWYILDDPNLCRSR